MNIADMFEHTMDGVHAYVDDITEYYSSEDHAFDLGMYSHDGRFFEDTGALVYSYTLEVLLDLVINKGLIVIAFPCDTTGDHIYTFA